MLLKSSFLCVSLFLVKSISSQCFPSPPLGPILPVDPFGPNYGPLGGPFGPGLGPAISPVIAPAVGGNGGSFSVTSASPIAPTGLSILSENLAIDGGVAVGGQIPFLGTVGVAGEYPTYGAGAVAYGCGDGSIGMMAESPLGLGTVGATGLGPRPGCGNGVWY